MSFEHLPKLEFFFKGFPEDVRLTKHSVPASLAIARGSIYEAWYRCVKLSPYLAEAIDSGEWRSDALRQTYEWFGDLRGTTFDEWWVEVGYGIFKEGKEFRRIHLSEITEDLPPKTIRFDVPLTTSPATLKKQFDALLKKHHPHYKQFDRFKQSTAIAPLKLSKLSSPSINLYLQAYEKQQELKKTNPSVKLYEVGEAMNANPKNVVKESDHSVVKKEKRFLMSQQVTEYIEKARDLIANASEGVFPSTESHRWVERGIRRRFD
jgi:hypothetical protein